MNSYFFMQRFMYPYHKVLPMILPAVHPLSVGSHTDEVVWQPILENKTLTNKNHQNYFLFRKYGMKVCPNELHMLNSSAVKAMVVMVVMPSIVSREAFAVSRWGDDTMARGTVGPITASTACNGPQRCDGERHGTGSE